MKNLNDNYLYSDTQCFLYQRDKILEIVIVNNMI